ncbi:oligosaccharide flippase family protein [Salinibacterium sp. SWN1162]|uniref:oligosaccharide flippase family protein n=1 Tax=Salinibacterium sp. SWN1162 TaxID=2792053 RepID=UPI0018CE6995|nr:oligosaccharide flippase family protein [Salinibacterium sp. SWN1162]MBH0009614.1 oligosaccharide flippase family protein [Salinibacterium sp. SWN1162]
MSQTENPSRGVRAVVSGTALLSSTMLAVSAANYGLNLVLARLMSPAEFGDASLAITLVLAAAVVAATLQLVASKAVASVPETAEGARHTLMRGALIAGLIVVVVMGGGAWVLADLLNTSTPWMFVLISLGLPIYFVQAVHRGVLQGQLRFSRLALTYGVEAAVRVVVVLVLVIAGLGVIGASIGILLSFVASATVARGRRVAAGERGAAVPWAVLRATVTAAVILLIGQTLMNYADLVLAKATFDPQIAGVYAAAAVLGRAVFFVSWSVVNSVFPVIASRSTSPAQRLRAIGVAIGIIAAVGAAATTAAALWGEVAITFAFGSEYAAAGALLVPYSLATSLFAVVNLLAAARVALGMAGAPILLLVAAAVQTVALVLWGTSPELLVWLQVAGTGAALIAMAALWLVRPLSRTDASAIS